MAKQITEYANEVLNEKRLKDMRDSIAGGLLTSASLATDSKQSSEQVLVKQDALEQRFIDLQQATTDGDFNSAPEIIDARGGKVTLGQRLDDADAQLAQKANQAFVDAQFSSIVSGAPKGTYTDLTALQTAYPNGAEGVFLVLENGRWYYWQSTTSTWTDGGVYQSDGIADGSVTLAKLSVSLQNFYNDFNGMLTDDNGIWEV